MEEIFSIASLVLNVGMVGWIYFNLGQMRSDISGIVYRLQRMEDAFRLKLKKGDE